MFLSRVSRQFAITTAAIAIVATPAVASVVIQSYMRSDVTVGPNCLVSEAGTDTATYQTEQGPFAGFATGDMATTRVTLEEDTLSVRGMRGDRVIYTDVARIRNECQVELTVNLRAEGSQGQGWQNRYAEVYLSSATRPLGTSEYFGFPGDGSGNWTAAPLAIDGGGLVSPTSAPVVLPAGQEARIATVIEAGSDPSVMEQVSILSWEVTALHNNGA